MPMPDDMRSCPVGWGTILKIHEKPNQENLMPVTMDVGKVAKLARLFFSDEGEQDLSLKLNDILSYMEQLERLDTGDIEPTTHVLPLKNVFREDVVVPSLPQKDLLANAPDQAMGCFRVPKVIE
ncbi:MAG: Asp-tRNA(Asn)/Glu-tRNA(Gln) amidotransferase subunit GatC [Candidatus Latescibacterota bacterium]